MGVAPFLAGDLVKTVAAAAVARVITPGRDYRV
jgi:biotin transporter BioY